jgi:hypothetical protein
MKELKLDEKFTRIDGKKLTKKQKEKVRAIRHSDVHYVSQLAYPIYVLNGVILSSLNMYDH